MRNYTSQNGPVAQLGREIYPEDASRQKRPAHILSSFLEKRDLRNRSVEGSNPSGPILVNQANIHNPTEVVFEDP